MNFYPTSCGGVVGRHGEQRVSGDSLQLLRSTLAASSGIQSCDSSVKSPFRYPLGHHCLSERAPGKTYPLFLLPIINIFFYNKVLNLYAILCFFMPVTQGVFTAFHLHPGI